jgi:CHAD domain-containing protein
MTGSREIQYLLPEGMGAQAAVDLLSEHLDVEGARTRAVDQRFYDTFDGRLHGAGLTLTFETGRPSGRLSLTDAAGQVRSVEEQAKARRVLFCPDLPPGSMRDALGPIVENRALTPLARVRGRLHPLAVVDDERKTVVRLVVQEAALAGPGRSSTPLESRVRAVPVRGYDDEFEGVLSTLATEVGLEEASLSLQDEAVQAAGGTPGGVSSKLAVAIEPGQRADRATATALGGPLATMEATLPGAIADLDPEFLHDLRVAVRRTRSLQRQLSGVFPEEPLAHFRAEFRWLQQTTGELRDLDVHREDISRFREGAPEALGADLQPLEEMLHARRIAEHRRTTRCLKSDRTTQLIADWTSFLDDFPTAPEAERPQAAARIVDVAAGRIHTVYRRMVKMGKAIDESSPPEALHDLRKKGKELRYMLEFFGGLYPRDVVKPMVATLKALQDTLGRYQDQEVQAQTLRSLREELGGREGGASALMAMGLVVESLEQDHAAARSEFAERLEPFARKAQRKLVDATFS